MDANISELIGKTIIKIEGLKKDNDTVTFILSNGEQYTMYHQQDCCEHVSIEDITGFISDIIDSPILKAEERTSNENPFGITKEYQDSFTWTFYELATIKGYVTIRWYGSSNGYYSERVDIVKSGKQLTEGYVLHTEE